MTDTRWRVNPIGSDFNVNDGYSLDPYGTSAYGSESEYDPKLTDVEVIDAFNRFARAATLYVDDETANRLQVYSRGTRVELEYTTDGGNNWTRRWAGFVQDVIEKDERNSNQVRVECVGYDHLLKRRDDIAKDYSSQTISSIIQDVIENFTPVTYVGSNVSVTSDVTIDYTNDGTRPDQILKDLSSISGDEEFGVNDDFEFFFEPRETEASPVNILDGDYFDYDLPNEGKRSINRVRLNYGEGGNESFVIVEDRAAQQQLEDELNAAGPVVLSKTKTYPSISTEEEAKNRAEQLLGTFTQIQTGEVQTFDRHEMEPGDTFRLQISPKGIDDTFRCAQIKYFWRDDRTEVTVAERSQTGNDELLVELSDDVSRIDQRAADFDAQGTQFLSQTSGITISKSADLSRDNIGTSRFVPGYGRDAPGLSRKNLGYPSTSQTELTVQSQVVTAAGLNRFRDAWQGEAINAIDELKFGTGTSDASVGDSALGNPVATTSAVADANGTNEILLSGTLTSGGAAEGSNLTELGFFANGTLVFRATFDASLHDSDTEHDVTITLTVDDDPNAIGVITETGQTEVRNGWIDGTIDEPTDMAFGTGTTAPAETDTTLGNKIIEKAITDTQDKSAGITDVVARLGTGEANGNDLAELGEENVNNDLLSRIVYDAISKTSDFALESNHRFRAKNA